MKPPRPESTVDHDAATVRFVVQPECEGEPATELVSAWLTRPYLDDLETIRAVTGERLDDIMVRHSKSNVAMEARRIRLADRAEELQRGGS
jgi:hypothetical protein